MVKNPNTILETQHSIQLLGVIRCNLIWLEYKEFGKVYGFEAFETFTCPDEVHPLVFAQMCTLYHQGKAQAHSASSTFNSSQLNSISQSTSFSGSSIPVNTLEINFKAKKKTIAQVWKQFLVKYGWVAHMKLSVFWPIQ